MYVYMTLGREFGGIWEEFERGTSGVNDQYCMYLRNSEKNNHIYGYI